MERNILKEIALSEELRASIRYIELGIGELQNLDSSNDFYHLPMQLLANGFERLLKCHICYGHLEQKGKFPVFLDLKKCGGTSGHGLVELKEMVVSSYFKNPNNAHALSEDLKFLKNDSQLNRIVDMLSEFGKYSRYYNLDVVTDNNNPSRDIKSEWEELEKDIAFANPRLVDRLVNLETHMEASMQIDREIVITLEKFTRAICRQFTLGQLGAKALQHSGILSKFYLMSDEAIGNSDYRKLTSNYASSVKSGHKRINADEVERLSNPNFHHKQISKNEFDGDWPFYHEEVVIECRENHWCVVTINGEDFALNGAAQGRYKLEGVHDAGMAILGKSIGPFVQMALELSQDKRVIK